MDLLVALAPRLGADAAACVALSLKETRRTAVVCLQRAVRRLLALRQLELRVVMELARLLDGNRYAAPAVQKALPGLRPLPFVRQMVVLRVIIS